MILTNYMSSKFNIYYSMIDKDLIEKFYLMLHPKPAYIIGSGIYNSETNPMASSWVTPVSEEPPHIVIAIDKESYTNELIKKYGVYSVNILSEEYIDKIFYVGSRSNRKLVKYRL